MSSAPDSSARAEERFLLLELENSRRLENLLSPPLRATISNGQFPSLGQRQTKPNACLGMRIEQRQAFSVTQSNPQGLCIAQSEAPRTTPPAKLDDRYLVPCKWAAGVDVQAHVGVFDVAGRRIDEGGKLEIADRAIGIGVGRDARAIDRLAGILEIRGR